MPSKSTSLSAKPRQTNPDPSHQDVVEQQNALSEINRDLSAGRFQQVLSDASRVMWVPSLRRDALRLSVHAYLGLGDIKAAAHSAGQLCRLESVPTGDLILLAVVQIRCGDIAKAASVLANLLEREPRDLLAARTALHLGPELKGLLSAVETAFIWNAATHADARDGLRQLVSDGQRPCAVFVENGTLAGFVDLARVENPHLGVGLFWRGNCIDRIQFQKTSTLSPGRDLAHFTLDVPAELRRAPLELTFGGADPVALGPTIKSMLRPPELVGAWYLEEDDLIVQAMDLGCPDRPVSVAVAFDGKPSPPLTFLLPRNRAQPMTVTATEGLLAKIPTGTTRISLRFLGTDEPLAEINAVNSGIPRQSQRPDPDLPIDVILPVYGDADATLACLDSLFSNSPGIAATIIVIDDDTPDPLIRRVLIQHAAAGRITLLRNPGNLGFVRTVNRGMALHPDRDVVLLNADTIVHGNWLQRLRQAAYRRPDIGTVTPLSNDATILSYPAANAPTPIGSVDIAAMDRLASDVNAGESVEIPTAIGFCMFIRRACLEEVGYFDPVSFGTGYGEENDFCRRAANAGWRNIAAADVYVGHVGGASFGAEKQSRIEKALRIVEDRHPGYHALIQDFLTADPIGIVRRRMDVGQLAGLSVRPLLIVCAKLGGGTGRYVDEAMTKVGRQSMVLVRPEQVGERYRLRLEIPDRPDLRNLIFDQMTEIPALLDCLRQIGIARMDLHHVLQMTDAALLALTGAFPYRVFTHDFSWLCPRITLVNADSVYCGQPADITVCETCIQQGGQRLRPGLSATAWRQLAGSILHKAETLICSTEDTRRRYSHMVGAAPVLAPPEPEPTIAVRSPRHADVTRVAAVGGLGLEKGYSVLLACAAHAARYDLPLTFAVIGFTLDDGALIATGRVEVSGSYSEADGPVLLAEADADVGFCPSIWPETWCYTLTMGFAAGLPVLSFDLGAQSERIQATGRGRVIPLGSSAAAICQELMALARNR